MPVLLPRIYAVDNEMLRAWETEKPLTSLKAYLSREHSKALQSWHFEEALSRICCSVSHGHNPCRTNHLPIIPLQALENPQKFQSALYSDRVMSTEMLEILYLLGVESIEGIGATPWVRSTLETDQATL